MAKVKIQGNASGTGVLTVTAPNTSTDRTITLPDSTDTLAVNSDVTNKLPLAGGTLTGGLSGTTASFTSTATSPVQINGTSIPTLTVRNSTTPVELQMRATTTTGLVRTATNHPLVFGVNAAEKMRLTSDGLTFNGDTAAANALDDYEEGTWTPVLADASGNAIAGSQSGFYTKIGRAVHFEFNLNVGSHSGTTGGNEAQVNGFPFAVANTIYSPHTTSCGSMASNVGDCVILQIFPSTSYGRFYKDNWNTSSHVSVKIQDFGTSGFVRCSGTYYTT